MKTVSLELGKQKPKYGRIAQETYKGSAKAQEKKNLLDKIAGMILGGCPKEVAVKSTDISLRTYYSYKTSYAQRGIKVQRETPYIKSVQVDGGSEF